MLHAKASQCVTNNQPCIIPRNSQASCVPRGESTVAVSEEITRHQSLMRCSVIIRIRHPSRIVSGLLNRSARVLVIRRGRELVACPPQDPDKNSCCAFITYLLRIASMPDKVAAPDESLQAK